MRRFPLANKQLRMKTELIRTEIDFLINLLMRNPKGLTFKQIVSEWQRAYNKNLTIQTFKRRLTCIREMCNVECSHNIYKYISSYIPDSNSLREWGMNVQAIESRMKDCETIASRILLEEIPSSTYLDCVLASMKHNTIIEITYREYGNTCSENITIEPYCLKTYHNRWYILGKCEDRKFRIYCMDRIEGIKAIEKTFTMIPNFNAHNFFSEYYGVRLDSDIEVEHVILRAHENERFILKRQKIHHSQNIRTEGDNYTDFDLYLRPTFDFVSYLESQGRFIEVIKPKRLREELLRVHREAIERNRII